MFNLFDTPLFWGVTFLGISFTHYFLEQLDPDPSSCLSFTPFDIYKQIFEVHKIAVTKVKRNLDIFIQIVNVIMNLTLTVKFQLNSKAETKLKNFNAHLHVSTVKYSRLLT